MKHHKRQNSTSLVGGRFSDFKNSFDYESECFLRTYVKKKLILKTCEEMSTDIKDEELESTRSDIFSNRGAFASEKLCPRTLIGFLQ